MKQCDVTKRHRTSQWRRAMRVGAALCLASAIAFPLAAQDSPVRIATAPVQIGAVTVDGEIRVRGEGWDLFLPDFQTRYGWGSSLLRLGIGQHRPRWDWKIEIEQPTLFQMPQDAVAPPGYPLGTGAIHFLANRGNRNAASIFVKEGYIRVRGLAGNGGTLQLGRFAFVDGAELLPRDRDLAWIKRQRLAERLVGSADSSAVGRSFDGALFSDNLTSKSNVTLLAARPTRGVYQTDGIGEVGVTALYAAYTRQFTRGHAFSEVRGFGVGYFDGRNLQIDNRPPSARQRDNQSLRLGTFGLHALLVVPLPLSFKWDSLVWGAYQTGSWGQLQQRAWAVAAETGWRIPIPWIHPWMRAGLMIGSGDGNPLDGKHQTFFQPLPNQQLYARIPIYTMQNVEDYTGQLILRPHERVWIRTEIHKFKLHSVHDLWYVGSGAYQNTSFGYFGLAPNGHRGLANYLDTSVEARLTSHLDASVYFGVLAGKSLLTNDLHGRKGGLGYVELAYRF
jgi:hypothetical protein